ncbi:hypothetical protein OVA10_23400 [Lelliottia sp. SL45]|uniref:hypothetical protein n=1 Tax=Lelliottia sp. SL45 TaxID=2994665 RepID=UPI0022737B78|nr:hypothetical protein [Lelliottia sp. SL45]MCY1700961.1 hypothetical protein [Lelliottia sp. SL45]
MNQQPGSCENTYGAREFRSEFKFLVINYTHRLNITIKSKISLSPDKLVSLNCVKNIKAM